MQGVSRDGKLHNSIWSWCQLAFGIAGNRYVSVARVNEGKTNCTKQGDEGFRGTAATQALCGQS